MQKEEILNVLNESLEMEKKGHKFYKEGAEKIKNSLGRKMLQRLAEDELIHIKRIKEIYSSLSEGDLSDISIEAAPAETFESIFSRMKEQIEEAVEDLSEIGVNDEEIINVALELESHARFYYQKAAEKADNDTVKKFYEMLAREEKNHYDLLVNTNNYMENPSLFYGMGYH
jgi:rubrerythrin